MNQPDSMTLLGTLDRQRSSNESLANLFARLAQCCLLLVVVLSPWGFGSVHSWTQCLMAIGLLIGLGIWWFESAVDSDKSQQIPYIVFLLLGGLAIALIQLLPLPEMASFLLGRQREIYQEFTGQPPSAVRISLFPQGTWHLFQLLLIALSTTLLASRYFRTTKEMIVLMVVAAANGFLLSVLGIAQKLTSDNRIFWLFEFEHGPFASFVNRNNAAGYLLMALACCAGLLPILMPMRITSGPPPLISREMPYWRQLGQYFSFFLAELNSAKIMLLVATVVISSAVIASTSRGGSLSLLVGLVATFLTFGLARRPQNMSLIMLPLITLVVALSAWVGFSDQLLKRWETTEMVEFSKTDARIQHWRETAPAIQEMGILGSGLGSYRHVHRLYSQSNERGVFEYAENQYFQSLIESGWPGFLLFMAAWALAFLYAMLLIIRGQSDTTVGVGTMGVFLLTSQATASLFDFGLYIPANMVLMASLVGLLGYQAHAFAARLKKSNWLRFRVHNRLIQIGLIVAFGCLSASALNLYRHARIDEAIRNGDRIARNPKGDWSYQQLGLSQVDRRIEDMKSKLRNCRSINGLNHLGDLYIHRFRLMRLEALEKTEDYRNTFSLAVDEKERQSLKEDAWHLTRMEHIRDYIQDQGHNYSQLRAIALTKQPFISENVPLAYGSFAVSRANAPLQPVVHMKLGQLNGLLTFSKDEIRGGDEIEAAIKIAPANAQYRLIAGIFFVQCHDLAAAAPHFKRFLELSGHELATAMDVLYARTDFNSFAVPPKTVLETMMPDDPLIMYHFAKRWCSTDPQTKTSALNHTESLLEGSNLGEQEKLKILADVQLERGETDLAIDTMAAILRGNPLEETIRFQRAHLLYQAKRFQEALDEAEILIRSNRMDRGYNDLLKHIKSQIQRLEESQ